MNSSVFWALVRKDLYLMRGFMVATIATGVLAGVLTKFGKIGFAVGGVLFLTADIAGGLFIAMFSLVGERKGQSRMFALSLPISGYRHELTKLVGGYLTYGIPWLVLTALALIGFVVPGAEHGMIVYILVLQLFVFALYSVVLGALFVATSEAMSGLVILIINICFSLFVVELNQPQVSGPLHSPTIVWTPFAVTALSADVGVLVLSVAASLYFMSRRRDFI